MQQPYGLRAKGNLWWWFLLLDLSLSAHIRISIKLNIDQGRTCCQFQGEKPELPRKQESVKVTSYFHLQEKKTYNLKIHSKGWAFCQKESNGFFLFMYDKNSHWYSKPVSFSLTNNELKQPLAVNIYVFFSWPRDFWTTHGSRTSQHQHSHPAGAWAGAGTSALKNHHSDKIFGVACCLLNIFQIQISSGKWRKICLTKKAVSSAGWPKKKRRKNQRSFSDASISIETEIWGSKTYMTA